MGIHPFSLAGAERGSTYSDLGPIRPEEKVDRRRRALETNCFTIYVNSHLSEGNRGYDRRWSTPNGRMTIKRPKESSGSKTMNSRRRKGATNSGTKGIARPPNSREEVGIPNKLSNTAEKPSFRDGDQKKIEKYTRGRGVSRLRVSRRQYIRKRCWAQQY